MNNSKLIWKGIREIIQNTKATKSNNISIEINDILISDPEIMTNSFNNFLRQLQIKSEIIFLLLVNILKNMLVTVLIILFFSPIYNLEITKIINSLDPKKATGPFSIPNQILKTILCDVSDILADILNLLVTYHS